MGEWSRGRRGGGGGRGRGVYQWRPPQGLCWGLGPVRKYTPSRSAGTSPSTDRGCVNTSVETGANSGCSRKGLAFVRCHHCKLLTNSRGRNLHVCAA